MKTHLVRASASTRARKSADHQLRSRSRRTGSQGQADCDFAVSWGYDALGLPRQRRSFAITTSPTATYWLIPLPHGATSSKRSEDFGPWLRGTNRISSARRTCRGSSLMPSAMLAIKLRPQIGRRRAARMVLPSRRSSEIGTPCCDYRRLRSSAPVTSETTSRSAIIALAQSVSKLRAG